jgi:hypothetical protein
MWSLVRPTGVSKFINLDMISEPCQMLAGLSQVGFAWCCLAAGGGFRLVLSRRRRWVSPGVVSPQEASHHVPGPR